MFAACRYRLLTGIALELFAFGCRNDGKIWLTNPRAERVFNGHRINGISEFFHILKELF